MRETVSFLTRVALVLSCGVILSSTAAADDPCVDAGNKIKTFTSSLRSVVPVKVPHGKFDVKEASSRFEIFYRSNGKTVFHGSYLKRDTYMMYDTTPITGAGYSGLLINANGGGSGGPQCAYVVFPSLRSNEFIFKDLLGPSGYPAGTRPPLYVASGAMAEDIDSDGDTEIVIREAANWSWDWNCPFSHADTPYWPRIMHFSPHLGQMVDVSERFPRYYASLAEQFKKLNNELSSATNMPPRCESELQRLIKKAEGLGQRSKQAGVTADRNGDIWVTDQVAVLSAEQHKEISALLQSHNQKGPGRIFLLIVKQLPANTTIERYANDKINEPALAGNEKVDRILLVIALQNRQLRIETSQEVGEALPDAFCKEVINRLIVPKFKAQQYYEGIYAGISALIKKLTEY